MKLGNLYLLLVVFVAAQCASVPKELQTQAESNSLRIAIASVKDLGQKYSTVAGTYTTKDPSIHYIEYVVVFQNNRPEPVAVSLMTFFASPVLEASLDGEKTKLPFTAKGFDACCGFAAAWAHIVHDFRISTGSGSKTHFRELGPQESVAVSLVFMVPAGQRHSKLVYDLNDKTIESVKEMEENDLFAHPDAPYFHTRVEIPIPQS